MKTRILKIALIFTAAVVGLLSLTAIGHGLIYRNRIYPGVRINTLDVGGLTTKQAQVKVAAAFSPRDTIDLKFKNKKWLLNLHDIDARVKAKQSATSAFDVGRRHGLSANLIDRYAAWSSGTRLPVAWSLDENRALKTLKRMAKTINQPSVDAKIQISGKDISIIPHQNQQTLLFKRTVDRLKSRLNNKIKSVDLVVKITKPDQTTRDIKKLKVEKQVAEFSTSLPASRSGRHHNIELATSNLDNTYIAPGETFSFNKTVGPRTRAAGFTDAPVIERGQLVQGIGGGICQVATTIYNAAMIAGLPVVDRTVHSNYISHYPAGRDATVVYGLLDFKFKNDTEGTIIIKAEVTNNAVVFRLYGQDTGRVNWFGDPVVYNIVPFPSRTVTDTAVPPGTSRYEQRGVSGRTIKVRRRVTVGKKKLIEETIISRYTPREQIIKVGPALPPEPPKESSATP